MKIIHTYWTNGGKDYKCRFPNQQAFDKFAKLTVDRSMDLYGNVEIYTDTEGAAKLDGMFAPEVVITTIDYSEYDFDKMFWNFPKLISYNLQTGPFLHIDFDVIICQKVLTTDDILTEKKRASGIQIGWNKYNLVDQVPNSLICSGMVGGTDLQIFKDLYDISKEVVKEANVENEEVSNPLDLIEIEEVVLSDLALSRNSSVHEFGYENYIHLQGSGKSHI